MALCTAGALEVQILLKEFNQPIDATYNSHKLFLNLKLGNDFLQHVNICLLLACCYGKEIKVGIFIH